MNTASRRNSLIISICLFSLLAQLPLTIFLPYDAIAARSSLSLEALAAFLVIFLVRRRLRRRDIELPWIVPFLFVADIWLNATANFLNFYTRFFYWDNLAHFLGTSVVTVGILVILKILQQRGMINMGGLFLAIVALSLAMSLSVIYEIFEYTGDQLFGTHRVTGLYDTSSDLLLNTSGALLVIILAHPKSILQRLAGKKLPTLDEESPF